ncbi:Hemicentin-1 [Holothuria leucospilota]|uniref:Hemicentin-1 n=1 Tax=Holothuria leucospilota TaxID=206669 RepID=A0A9Q1CKV2_HOLLE|nr:Hemicentin-1 [Holothuria leucospilota]
MYFKVQKCSIILLVTFIAGAASDFCFRNRAPAGPFGRCDDMIPNINTARQCCRAGGAGWTEKQSGKRCGPACSGNEPTTVPPEEEPTTTQPPAEVKLCFRTREPRGIMGSCGDLMGERTREDCCRQGGKGWTDRPNGKRCEDACHGVDVFSGPTHYCFSRLNARGRCFQSLGQKTKIQCCQDGGVGWSSNPNGRACESACEEPLRPVVHGGWSEWGDWSQCSVSCLEGIQTRRRRCNNPAPDNGGDDCVGPNSEQAICDEGPCPIDGEWGPWRNAGECSATCYYEGSPVYRHMRRRCNNPVPMYGGKDCTGSARKKVVCLDLPHCPVHGGWGPWRNAGECSATCYYEGRSVYRHMRRRCNNPVPQHDGDDCRGLERKNVVCLDLPHCPVDGGWSDYGEWSECSQTCEEGIQTRIRTCTNPTPQYGGLECEGDDRETQICGNRCPGHGGWSDWGPWSPCDSPRCGVDGTKFRSRSCTNPRPKKRRHYCVGPIIDRETCSKCPVPGGWSDWSQWGPCSGNCRKGDFRLRYRTCNNPGGSCEGDFKQHGECEGLNPCPNRIDGEGSGSGDGSGDLDIFPCDDEDLCSYVSGGDEDENSFSYSPGDSIEQPKDVTPTPKPCDNDYSYSIEEYNDRDQAGCQENQPEVAELDSISYDYYGDNNDGQNEDQSSAPQGPVKAGKGGDSESYSFYDIEVNSGNGGAQQNVPQVEENNGDSDSYSFDDGEGNASNGGAPQSAPQVEENNGDSDSYSFDDGEGNAGNSGAPQSAPQVEENNGDSDSYSFNDGEGNAGNGGAPQNVPQVEENNGDSDSYSFNDGEGNAGNGGAPQNAPQVEKDNGDSNSYSFDEGEGNAGNSGAPQSAPQVEENNGDSDSLSFNDGEGNAGNGGAPQNAPQVEENNGDSDSYSFNDGEGNAGNGGAPRNAPQVEENNGDSDSYSFDDGEGNAGNGGAPQSAPQVEDYNGDSDSYSFDQLEGNAGPAEANGQNTGNGQDEQLGDYNYSGSV